MKKTGFKGAFDSGRTGGFTLVEILMAIAISMVVSFAIYSVYSTFYRQTAAQDLMLEAQQNARVGINLIERELMTAGYGAGTVDVLTTATDTSIQFLYVEPSDDNGYRRRVTYNYDSGTRSLLRQEDNVTTGTTGSTNVLVPDVAGLTIAYYDENGVSIPAPISPTALIGSIKLINTVKYIDVTVITETKSIPPGASAKKTFVLRTHVRLRSIGIGLSSSATSDSTPPSAPGGLQVREAANPAGTGGSCGKLKVKFTGSPDGDVAGHKIYYGTALNAYDGVINVPISQLSGADYTCTTSGSVYTCTIAPTTPALAPTLSYDYGTSLHAPSTAVIYYFAVKAYDTALLHSDYSNVAYGDSSTATIATSNTVFDSGSNDSTVNPGKPGAVTGLTGADGSADGTVSLSWTAYPTASNPGVTQLAVYRSTAAFTYPIDPARELTAITTPGTTTTYADTGLSGCVQYYYAIAPINCDPALVSVDAGDTASEQFAAADYAVAYGDGAGSAVDSPSGADTYPPDITATAAPDLLKRNGEIVVGYKRVYMGVTNPTESDFSHTLVYYNTTGPSPTVDTTLGSVTYGNISGGLAVPDSNAGVPGKLTGAGRYIGYIHDNEQIADNSFFEGVNAMHVPALTGTQYYYTAVSYDRCGNPAVATGNTPALDTLCGDAVSPLPEAGPPSAIPPITPLVKGCYSNDYSYVVSFNSRNINAVNAPMTITWSDNSLLATIPDVAGYRVYRSPSSPFNTALIPSDINSTLCSSSPTVPCYLGYISVGTNNSLADNYGLTDTGTTKYSYGIVTTDCAYEERYIPYLEAAYKFNTSGWTTYFGAEGIGVTPGMIDRDEKLTVTDDSHREVLTGVTLDTSSGAGTGASTPSTDYKHSTVTLFLENTANGPQMLSADSVSTFFWVNSSARLTNVAVGGGKSAFAVTNVAVSSSANYFNAGTYTRRAATTLGNIQLPANTRNIPLVLTFADTSGNPVDMRADQLLIKLIVINNSTNVSGNPLCYAYATVLKSNAATTVPYGPSVNSVTQNNPSAPTFVYAVPGSTGFNTVPTDGATYGTIKAIGNTSTVVTANIVANTLYEPTRGFVSVSSATLYYIETALTVGAAPASGYTAVVMAHPSGNTWTGTIPAMVGATGRRFWFYIVAVDSDGNYDRAPESSDGAYTYDQKPFGVCDVTPNAPAVYSGYSYSLTQRVAPTATAVSIKWKEVTTYTDGTAINKTTDPIVYRVFRRSSTTGAFTKLFDVPDPNANSGS